MVSSQRSGKQPIKMEKNARNEMLTKLTQQQGCEGNRQRQTQNKRPNE